MLHAGEKLPRSCADIDAGRGQKSEALPKRGWGMGGGVVGLEFRAYTLETPCKNTETIRALKHITSLNWWIPLPVGSGVFIY